MKVPRSHPIYNAWTAMRQRCNNLFHHQYSRYGGRGIDYDPRYDSFQVFAGDMLPTWKPGLYLDRYPDNDGGYWKENLRWATSAESGQNRSTNKLTKEDVDAIRRLADRGESKSTLAQEFLVRTDYIADVVERRVWRNV